MKKPYQNVWILNTYQENDVYKILHDKFTLNFNLRLFIATFIGHLLTRPIKFNIVKVDDIAKY